MLHLKTKVVAIISGLLLSVSIATCFINYKVDIHAAEEQLKNISLPLSIDNIYTEIQQRMIEPLLVSSLMAHDTFLRDWLLNGEKEVDSISKYLKEIQSKYTVFTSFLVSDITKNYYHPQGLIDVVNEKNSNDAWFYEFRKNPEPYEVNLDKNVHLGDFLVMFINYKVMNFNNEMIGATGVGVRLFHIEQMLNSFKEKYKYNVYFIDTTGEITLYSKMLNKRGNIANIEGLKDIKEAIFTNTTTQYEYKNKDGSYHLHTKYIEKLKLYLMVEIDKKEYMDALQKTFFTNITISLLVTLVITFIIIYTINLYQKQLVLMANEDSLTQLFNRRKFNEYFERIYKAYPISVKKITLILIDIDDFKQVNDTFGHLVGDQVLIRVARIIQNVLRSTDMVARWGGEEFSILLVNVPKDEAVKIAEKIRLCIKEDSELFNTLNSSLTVSLGLGEITSSDSQDGLVYKVDKALYEAKSNGKDQLIII